MRIRRQRARNVRRRDESLLVIADAGKKRARAIVVEFGEDVVEQQQRRFAGALPRHGIFGHLQREHGRALLPLRAVDGERTPVERERQIVAVRSCNRSLACSFRDGDVLQPRRQRCLDRFRGRRVERHVRLVFHPERFRAVGEARVCGVRRVREAFDERGACQYDTVPAAMSSRS